MNGRESEGNSFGSSPCEGGGGGLERRRHLVLGALSSPIREPLVSRFRPLPTMVQSYQRLQHSETFAKNSKYIEIRFIYYLSLLCGSAGTGLSGGTATRFS